MKVVASRDGFVLFERDDGTPPWRNFKLVRAEGPKRNWWLGWNGQRLADGRDRLKLTEHHPEIEQWLMSVLRTIQG
jgi:hypothetical protein